MASWLQRLMGFRSRRSRSPRATLPTRHHTAIQHQKMLRARARTQAKIAKAKAAQAKAYQAHLARQATQAAGHSVGASGQASQATQVTQVTQATQAPPSFFQSILRVPLSAQVYMLHQQQLKQQQLIKQQQLKQQQLQHKTRKKAPRKKAHRKKAHKAILAASRPQLRRLPSSMKPSMKSTKTWHGPGAPPTIDQAISYVRSLVAKRPFASMTATEKEKIKKICTNLALQPHYGGNILDVQRCINVANGKSRLGSYPGCSSCGILGELPDLLQNKAVLGIAAVAALLWWQSR